MDSVTEKLQNLLKKEEEKNAHDKKFVDTQNLIKQMEALGAIKKAEYSLPLVDTIGKSYYLTSNKHLSV